MLSKDRRTDFFPELVTEDEEPWQVQYGSGIMIDTKARVVGVPAAYDDMADEDSQSRIFNLARAKYSPVETLRPSMVPLDLFKQMLEEVKIDGILTSQHGIDASHRYDKQLTLLQSDLDKLERKDLAGIHLLLSTMRDNMTALILNEEVIEKLQPTDKEKKLFKDAIAGMLFYAKNPTKITSEQATQWRNQMAQTLMETMTAPPQPPEALQSITGENFSGSAYPIPASKKQQERGKTELDGFDSIEDLEDAADGLKPVPAGHGSPHTLGTMLIHDHITRNKKHAAIRMPRGAIAKGSVPELWHRFCEDKAVFRNRRKGGTVVIDGSGSMSWDWDYLHKKILELPALRASVYSGYAGPSYSGRMCILAKDGRWSPQERTTCHGNSDNNVDFEAITWLASQAKPRVLVSDGAFCGGRYDDGDRGRLQLHRLCIETMKRYNIYRVETMEEAISYVYTRRLPKAASQTSHVYW